MFIINPNWKNQLYFGDNLGIMREYIPDESVDLIYLDPPFNSNANYNVLFAEQDGAKSHSQIMAFEDTWTWDEHTDSVYRDLILNAPKKLSDLMRAFYKFLGMNDMAAYLVMMAARMVEMHRILKDTGSIYLHCDSTASHYIKLLMDTIFGLNNFRNEIIWSYGGRGAKAISKQFPRNHDILLFYSKNNSKHNYKKQYYDRIYSEEEAQKIGFKQDEKGRWFKTSPRGDYTDKSIEKLKQKDRIYITKNNTIRIKYFLNTKNNLVIEPMLVGDVWSDIPDAMHIGKERLGYPTQKPEALLERIIQASSNEGDVVLDPFCGCGTAVTVAEKLNRRWIGIDVTYLAIDLIQRRLQDSFKKDLSPFEVQGTPTDLESAKSLAKRDRYQFEWWAVSIIGARPAKDKKKGTDKGVDGYIFFYERENDKDVKTIIAQAKSGNVGVKDIRDFAWTTNREEAIIGAFITLQEPTEPMKKEALSAGVYKCEYTNKTYQKIQILTIEEILNGKKLDRPEGIDATFKKAERKSKVN